MKPNPFWMIRKDDRATCRYFFGNLFRYTQSWKPIWKLLRELIN